MFCLFFSFQGTRFLYRKFKWEQRSFQIELSATIISDVNFFWWLRIDLWELIRYFFFIKRDYHKRVWGLIMTKCHKRPQKRDFLVFISFKHLRIPFFDGLEFYNTLKHLRFPIFGVLVRVFLNFLYLKYWIFQFLWFGLLRFLVFCYWRAAFLIFDLIAPAYFNVWNLGTCVFKLPTLGHLRFLIFDIGACVF